jgi:thymidylate synthase (FAD)
MKVEHITHMGDDLMVVNAARVSFDKQSSYSEDMKLSEADTKLIAYLAKNGHWSPFSHPQLQVRVTVPIFIANQLKRSVVGFSINEVSRRYVDDEPTFYIPDEWRGRPPKSIKQGSSDEVITDIHEPYFELLAQAKNLYSNMLEAGVAPEMARMVLPQSMNTSWIWTGSLAAFCRVYKQRIDAHSQKESQIIAAQLGDILKAYFPVSFEALMND